MGDGSFNYHEPIGELTPQTREMHRALVSLQEELEAVDWYQQRADATADEDLRDLLLHNLREEVEHACMTLEWIRRHQPTFDTVLRKYLFTSGSLTALEEAVEGGGDPPTEASAPERGHLTIGTMKG